MGEKAATKETLLELMNLFQNPEKDVRNVACYTLIKISDKVATDDLITLADKQWNVRAAASETLKAFGDKVAIDQAVKALIPLLVDEKDEVQKAAYATLMNMPPKMSTQSNVDAITGMMYYHRIENAAQRALTGMFYKAIDISKLEIIHKALRSENDGVTYAVCEALMHAKSNAATADAIEALILILKRSETSCTRIALEALARMCYIAEPTRERPISYMYVARREPHYDLIRSAIRELFKHYESAHLHGIGGVINKALEDSDDDLRYKACEYIIRVDHHQTNEKTVRLLLRILKDSHSRLNRAVWEALGVVRYGAATNQVVDIVVKALKDPDHDINRDALEMIIKANKQVATKEIIRALNSILRDAQSRLKEYACNALAAMGNEAATEDVIDALNQAVRNSDVSKAACEALAAVSNAAAPEAIIDAFLYVLRLPKCHFKVTALRGLAAMGNKGVNQKTTDAIIEALQQSDGEFLREACKVLIATGDETTIKTTIDILIEKYKGDNYGMIKWAGEILVELAERKLLSAFMNVFIEAMQYSDKSVTALKVLTKMDYKSDVKDIVTAAIQASHNPAEDIKLSAYKWVWC
ncbi:unnamed protein product [Didymodactylos carnosus]|uniref:Uncharacterized protein n=1 Tax=Didymodactylos carnosus TaxID=1234261 RepID=A0A815XWU8_9BILA|nr:unnamed protein product [Didymodactylos carnosus]CAF1562746.1 unnamed protein product [Didymodactylos carnosus]CAF3887346.1 unnamed protein product [Didymodactylos carnosus]CAF4424365.1 unnamed protein product [Didymodactylos carnosus]